MLLAAITGGILELGRTALLELLVSLFALGLDSSVGGAEAEADWFS